MSERKNRRRFWFLIAVSVLLVSSMTSAFSDHDPASQVQIFSADFQTEIRPRHDEGMGSAAEGLVKASSAMDLMSIGSSKIKLTYENPVSHAQGTDELGYFDFEIEVGPLSEGKYPLDLTLSLRRAKNTVDFVRESLTVPEGEEVKLDSSLIEKFSISFADMVEKQSRKYSDKYGVKFDEKLREF